MSSEENTGLMTREKIIIIAVVGVVVVILGALLVVLILGCYLRYSRNEERHSIVAKNSIYRSPQKSAPDNPYATKVHLQSHKHNIGNDFNDTMGEKNGHFAGQSEETASNGMQIKFDI